MLYQVTVIRALILMSARLEAINAMMMLLVRTMLDPIPVNVILVTKVQFSSFFFEIEISTMLNNVIE